MDKEELKRLWETEYGCLDWDDIKDAIEHECLVSYSEGYDDGYADCEEDFV